MTIRDFLYLDADLLRSITAQIAGGVTDSVVEVASDGVTERLSLGRFGVNKTPTEETATSTSRSESRVYHDHQFTMIEKELQSSVLVVNDQSSEELISSVRNAFLVRVTGRSYIEDYGRLAIILQNFEKIGLALAQTQQESDEHRALIAETENKVKTLPNGPDKVIASNYLRELKNPKKRIDLGSNKLIDGLKVFVDVFRKDALEISTKASSLNYRFLSVLDPQWLRIAPDRLRRLYGTRTKIEFTVIGQVTYFPGEFEESEEPETSPAGTSDGSMGDALRNAVNATAQVEESFMQSSLGSEIVLRPLAIYRETDVNDLIRKSS